jgi:hypothetical protein
MTGLKTTWLFSEILSCVTGNRVDGVDWLHLAQNMDQWRVLVKRIKNIFSLKGGEFLD